MRKTVKFVTPLFIALVVSVGATAPAMADGPVEDTIDAVDRPW